MICTEAIDFVIASFAENDSGHEQDIKTLDTMLISLGLVAQRFVLRGDFSNINDLPKVPIILVMNASMAGPVSRAIYDSGIDVPIISYCAWELPRPPAGFADAPLDLVIAGSRFSYNSLVKSQYPICYLPALVEVPCEHDGEPRAVGGAFTFLSVFNLSSFAARKNPTGIVEAFANAFPESDQGVRLVLKVSGVEADPDCYNRLLDMAGRDRRVSVICQRMSRPAMLGLFDRCDAYVSLHRSEGFGRTLAEAMLRRKMVIATDWSGSTDLTCNEGCLACKYTLRPLSEGEYVESKGQFWAEPDLGHASELMVDATKLPSTARIERGTIARDWVLSNFGLEANKEAYSRALSSFLRADEVS